MTLLPSIARLCAFVFFFFFSRVACMETTRKQKHHHRERRPMMHSANERAPFFLLCAQAHVNTYFFLFFYVYVCVAYTARPKTKGKRDLSFSYSYIYLRNKSHHGIFLTRAISLTAKVYDKQIMASESKKKKERN